jgi:hypothetical protein
MNCPHCGSVDVRSSRRERWTDRFERLFGKVAFRCRSCRKRFFAPESANGDRQANANKRRHSKSPYTIARERQRILRRIFALVIFAIAFLLFWFMLQIAVSKPPSSGLVPIAPAASVA